MEYIINEKIVFDTTQNSLTNSETGQSVTLSISQSHMLEILINSNTEIVTKDKLINDLWDKHGISTSGHTLNQYVSILRKMLSNLGCEDVILTIPRVGLRINPVITTSSYKTEPLPPERITSKKTLWKIKYVLMIGGIAILTTLFTYYKSYHDKKTTYSSSIKKCVIKNIQDLSTADKLIMKKQAEEILLENKLSCNDDRVVFFDRYKLLSDDNYGRTLLSYCSVSDNGGIVSCDSYYYQNWRLK
ncbi:winged helix-turn-helix domain-containing protein [Enterobacter quasiroggenkampii]|nr:winged helix-turn-helix domain-containing protein [Enterobacter quasiroggenkampii]